MLEIRGVRNAIVDIMRRLLLTPPRNVFNKILIGILWNFQDSIDLWEFVWDFFKLFTEWIELENANHQFNWYLFYKVTALPCFCLFVVSNLTSTPTHL